MRYHSKQEILEAAMRQQAYDNACLETDFLREENTIVNYKMLPERRLFRDYDYFFKMTTFGRGAVISADPAIVLWCNSLRQHKGIQLFEFQSLRMIDEKLREFQQSLGCVHEGYLPDPAYQRRRTVEVEVKWFEAEEIPALYEDKRFFHALLYEENPSRPDMLAVAAYDKGIITGLAGCSRDSEMMWQIGIDVLPAYRGSGIAVALVGLLTDEILKRGKIPHYSTWCSNIASRLVAHQCGYFPAWTEVYSTKRE